MSNIEMLPFLNQNLLSIFAGYDIIISSINYIICIAMQKRSIKTLASLPFCFEFNKTIWSFCGSGTCNAVYRSEDGQLALKVPYNQDVNEDPDNPDRFIYILGKINQNKNGELKAVEIDTLMHEGVEKKMSTTLKASIIPFIECKRAPTDDELSNELIRIYTTTKRIAIDAFLEGNFVIRKDGNIHCNDPAYAINSRRNSIASENIWNKLQTNDYKQHYKKLFQIYSTSHPKTVNTIKSLMRIKSINDTLNQLRMHILCLQKTFYMRYMKTWSYANEIICEYHSKIEDLLDEQNEIQRNTLPKDNNKSIILTPDKIITEYVRNGGHPCRFYLFDKQSAKNCSQLIKKLQKRARKNPNGASAQTLGWINGDKTLDVDKIRERYYQNGGHGWRFFFNRKELTQEKLMENLQERAQKKPNGASAQTLEWVNIFKSQSSSSEDSNGNKEKILRPSS